jgi:predicted nucleotidyltransferase
MDEGHIDIRISMYPDQCREFLGRLARDDDFRAEFVEDAGGLLERFGIEISREAIPDEVELPPKEAVEDLLREVEERDKLGKTTPQAHGYAVLYMALGHAMPLVADDEPR